MGKIITVTLLCFILLGCKQESVTTIDTVELLYEIPVKADETSHYRSTVIPKGKILKLVDRHYQKDFLVLEVSFNNEVRYIIFDSRKVVIKEGAQ